MPGRLRVRGGPGHDIRGARAGQENPTLGELVKAATVPMPITTAPASFLLGASGENVPRLASFRDFTTQAARAFDERGRLSNSVAVEVAPALAMGRTTWDDIVGSSVARAWSRTLVSFATKVDGDAGGARSAFGLQTILWAPAMDAALAKMATPDCRSVMLGVNTDPPVVGPGDIPIPAPLKPAAVQLMDKCQVDIDALLTKWNQPMLALGAGRGFSDRGTGAAPNPSSIWATGAWGGDAGRADDTAAGRMGYLVTAHLRRTSGVLTTARDGSEVEARQRLTGVNARYGNARMAFVGEYSATRIRAAGVAFDDRRRSVLGLEFKLGKEDMYLTLGTARDTGLPRAQQSALARFHWGFGQQPTLLAK